MRLPALPRLALVPLLLLLAAPSLAHQQRVVRTATASARAVDGGVELDVLLWMRFAGERAAALRARFDVDRSGALDGGEMTLAGDSLAPEAIGGFFVRIDGAAQPPAKADARARSVDDAIEVAVLLSWTARPAKTIQLASRQGRDRPGAPPLLARFGALPPLAITARTPAGEKAIPLLPGGDGLRVELAVETPTEKEKP